MAEVEAIGGWLKDADSGLERGYRRLEDIAAFDPQRLAYFEDYRTRYFHAPLIPGLGVEPILETLARHGGAPNFWADLGAGVTTLFWAIGVNAPRAVAVCDLVPEALQVLSRFKASDGTAAVLFGRAAARRQVPRGFRRGPAAGLVLSCHGLFGALVDPRRGGRV